MHDPDEEPSVALDSSNILLAMPGSELRPDSALERLRKRNEETQGEQLMKLGENFEELLRLQKKSSGQKPRIPIKNTALKDKLLGKLKDGLLTSLIVYYDEIFAALMDEILEEEVRPFRVP